MTGPPITSPEDPVAAYKRKYGGAAAPVDPVARYKEKYGAATPDPDRFADVRGGSSTTASTGPSALSHLTNVGRGIPGGRAVMAGSETMFNKLAGKKDSFAAARDRQDADVGRINPATSLAENIVGSTAATMMMPGASVVKAGAMLGGADQLLSADDESLKARALKTAGGATIGAAAGKALSMGRTAFKGMRAPEPTANLVARKTARSAAAGPEYDAFRKLGDLGNTPKLDAILKLPAVERAVGTVQGESPRLAALPATHAEVLDAVYKRVGDKAFKALHGFETSEARASLASAIEEAANAKGGTYQGPLTVFKAHSEGMKGVQRGRDVLNNAVSPSGGSEQNAFTKSPAALKRDLPTITPQMAKGLKEGMYGQLGRKGSVSVKRILGTPLIPLPSKALRAADALRPHVDPTSTAELLKMLGVLNAPLANR